MDLFRGQPRIIWHVLPNKFHTIHRVSSRFSAVSMNINFIALLYNKSP